MALHVSVKVGTRLHAQYSADGVFYPAEVTAVSSSSSKKRAPVRIRFLGYGNEEWKSLNELKLKSSTISHAEQHGPVPNGQHSRFASQYSTKTVRKVDLDRMVQPGSCLQRFPRQLNATIAKLPLKSDLTNQIGGLQEDGITGKTCTVVLVDRSNRVRNLPLKWTAPYAPAVLEWLVEWTPTRWRVNGPGLKGRPIRQDQGAEAEEEDIPEGSIVEVDELEAARQREGASLTFTFSKYDTFPRQNTFLESEQLVGFGCPEECHLEIGPLSAAGAAWLQQHTDGFGKLTGSIKIQDIVKHDCDRNPNDPELELLRGFKRVHGVAASEMAGGLAQRLPTAREDQTVTFEYNPQVAVSHILLEKGVPEDDIWNAHFDLDYFALSDEALRIMSLSRSISGRSPTLRNLDLRKRCGVTVAGIARKQPQQNFDVSYDIHWFAGPDEPVREGDLFLVLREPSARPHGDSERIVRDEDIREFAKPYEQAEPCYICQVGVPNVKLEPCPGCFLCVECANKLPRRCPFDNRLIERFVLHATA